jgi:hypothetical protein
MVIPDLMFSDELKAAINAKHFKNLRTYRVPEE